VDVIRQLLDMLPDAAGRQAFVTQSQFQVPFLLDYVAVFLWAVSGAIAAMHKRYDFAGVLTIALVASTGGSMLRDGVFLQRTPPVLTNPWYIPLIVTATVMAGLFLRRLTQTVLVNRVINTIDAVGVPAFAIVGLQLSLQRGIPLPGVVLVGVANGVGGGILRDLLIGDTPTALQPGTIYVSGVIVICVLFLVLTYGLGLSNDFAAWSMIALFFGVRMLSVRYGWRTRPLLNEPPG
jgi:uncharacterized membrane protein YeiH